MSVASETSAHASALIRELFGDATLTFTRTVGQTENKATFSLTAGTDESFAVPGGALSWSVREVAASNGAILGGDRKVICEPDARIGAACRVDLGGVVYNIVPPIDTKGAGAYMRLNARR